MGVKFGTEEPNFKAKFHPHRCNVSPLRGENPQNRPLSKLNNRHFALRAMLPVNNNNKAGSAAAAASDKKIAKRFNSICLANSFSISESSV